MLPGLCPAWGAQNPLGPCPALPGGSLGARGVPGSHRHRRHSVCVHLSPDHTHDLLLDFGVLSIDIGVSHLAIFIPGRGEGGEGGPGGVSQVQQSGHSWTHTKKKRVQTWSETGQTQMLPCFCRSLEVITVGARGRWMRDRGPDWAQPIVGSLHPSTHLETPWVLPVPPVIPPHPHTFAKRDAVQVAALEEAGLDGAGLWEEQPVLPLCPQHPRVPCPIPILPRCPLAYHLGDRVHPVVPLYQLILRRHPVLPFPHSCGKARQGLSLSQRTPWGDVGTHATDRDCHLQCS